MSSQVQIKINAKIAVVTIDSPKTLNALNTRLIADLHNNLIALEKNNEVRVVVITGAGNKAFVAGANIKEFADFSVTEGKELSKKGHETLFNLVVNFSKPVIAAVNGYALGGGLELAMACHIRIASENAKMGLPEVSLGLIPGYGGTQRLTQLVGKGKAFEMILTAEMIDASEALKIGLINKVVCQSELMLTCKEFATKMIFNSPMALQKSINAINQLYSDKGLDAEINLFGSCFDTEDFKEGVSAFLEKRKPTF